VRGCAFSTEREPPHPNLLPTGERERTEPAAPSSRHSHLLKTARRRRSVAGFTLIEVLVALSVVAVSLTAIGSLIATTVRGIRSLDRRVALVETARAVMAGLPDREQLVPGSLSGELAGHRWRIDVSPLVTDADPQASAWTPYSVVVQVQPPSGPILQINTVRLRQRAAR
jgi:general secretion pathway protein I